MLDEELHTKEEPVIYTQPEGKRRLGCGTTKWYRMKNRGDLEIVRIGDRDYVTAACIRRILTPRQAA